MVEVSYGTKDGKLSEEEYKRIYMKNMPKKAIHKHQPGILEKLVTGGWTDELGRKMETDFHFFTAKPAGKEE